MDITILLRNLQSVVWLRALIVCGLHGLVIACTHTVDSTADAPDADPGDYICARAIPPDSEAAGADGLCTLRAAIMESNATFITERIEIPAGNYNLVLPAEQGGGALVVTGSVLIRGADAESTIIDGGGEVNFDPSVCYGGGTDAIFRITGGNVRISYLTVRGGGTHGLDIHAGTTEITDAIVQDNTAGGADAAGGMLIYENATVTLRRTAVVENCAPQAGGGIVNAGELFVYDSLIADNIANRVGGIYSDGILNLRNTTVSGNFVNAESSAGTGGINQLGFAFLNNVTITNNSGAGDAGLGSFTGGGIETGLFGTTVIKNSIIAGNHGNGGPDDCAGELTVDSRYNLIGNSDGCEFAGSTTTFLLDIDPELGALFGGNGGPTATHLLDATSPAREAGFPFTPGSGAADACEAHDQRGVPRPQGLGTCDLGAIEAGNAGGFVRGFVLVDTDADSDIQTIRNGEVLDLDVLPPSLSIRITGSAESAGSVVFDFDGTESFHTENQPPFGLGGDDPPGDFFPIELTPGSHSLTATPFQSDNGGGSAGGSLSVSFLVTSSN